MNDLLSLVVTVRPVEAATLPGHLGRAVYALLMRWLDESDPALARHWHDADGHKPFACSTLVGARRDGQNRRAVSPEKPYWFRLTSLDAAVSAVLRERLTRPPDVAELDGVAFRVETVTADPEVHPWAGTASYEDLAAPYLLARQQAPRRVRLSFVSPTTFRQNGINMPLPLPDLVFGGLADRWNAFSPVAISPEMRQFCESAVALNRYHFRSRAVPGKAGGLSIGAVGEARYVVVRFDRYWAGLLGLLADYAFFAGVGRATTTGMGQARRLPE